MDSLSCVRNGSRAGSGWELGKVLYCGHFGILSTRSFQTEERAPHRTKWGRRNFRQRKWLRVVSREFFPPLSTMGVHIL